MASWQAAAQAGRAVAAAERLSLLARVLGALDQVPDAETRIGADHVRVLEEATSAAHDAGKFERGIALATSALKELAPATEPVRVAQSLENLATSGSGWARGLRPGPAGRTGARAGGGSPAIRVKILLSPARCAPWVSQERSYAEAARVRPPDR